MEKKYNLPDQSPEMVQEDVTEYAQGMVIPVRVPTMGKYTMEELVKKLTSFALALVKSDPVEQTTVHYSPRIMRLHANSLNKITTKDIEDDERLAYLLNK